MIKHRRQNLINKLNRSYSLNSFEKEFLKTNDDRKNLPVNFICKISLWLSKNGLKINAGVFLTLIVVFLSFLLILCLFFRIGAILFLIISSVSIFAIYAFIDLKGRKAGEKKESQLEYFLLELIGNLYATSNLLIAIKKSIDNLEEPLKSEIENIITDSQRGLSLNEALENFRLKNRSKVIEIIVTGLIAANDKGSDLVSFLKDQLDYLRERKSLNSYIRILSAGPRYTSYVIAAMPLLVIAFSFVFNRNFSLFFISGTGIFVLLYMCLSYAIGFLLINKIVNLADKIDKNNFS